MNAAEFLYDFFDKESVYDADQAGYRFPDLSPLSMKSGKRLTSGKGKDDASKDFALLCLGGVNP